MKFSEYCKILDDAWAEQGGPPLDPETLAPITTKQKAERDFRFTPEWVIKHGGMENRMEAYFWCTENCKGRFALDKGRAFFTDEDDALMFRLVWSGS